MRSQILIFILAFAALMPCKAQGLENKSLWVPELSIDYQEINSVEVSPNGEKTLITYVDRDKDLIESIRFRVISNTDKQILFETPHGKRYGDVKWSPNGKWISYVTAEEDGSFLGITDAEKFNPIRVYAIPTNSWIESIQWSPNGKNISFITKFSEKDDAPSAYKFGGSSIVRERQYLNTPSRLSILSIDLKNNIFSGPSFLTPTNLAVTNEAGGGKASYIPYSWSADSASLAFSFVPVKEQNFNQETKLAILDIRTGKIKELNQEGPALNPVFSRNGKELAFLVAVTPPMNSPFKKANMVVTGLRVCLFDLEKDKERFLANTPNENPQIIGWDSDGSSI
ncbi:MAG: hypothetical protein H0X26_08500, partial [Alphaproteobacteria bacterium]|nr:hypothetical protein [Alphaproteobacteria bacterium]